MNHSVPSATGIRVLVSWRELVYRTWLFTTAVASYRREIVADNTSPGYALDSVSPYTCGLLTGLLGGLGDLGEGHWAGVHGLLRETEKQLAPTLGFPPIKAKRKLIEVVRQILV